jgi:hypothetical protein
MPARIDFDEEDVNYIVDAYRDAEWTLAELAREFEVSLGTIRKVLDSENVEVRGRGRRATA